MSDEIYRVKVLVPYYDYYSNKPTELSPYRILEVDSETILSDFAGIILSSFEFMFDHAFGFYDNVKKYYNSQNGFVMRFDDEDDFSSFDPHNKYGDVEKATVADMLTRKGKKWLFLFDYGDKWNFWVSLVDIVVKEKRTIYPRIIESYEKAPEQYEGYDEEDE